MGIEIGNGIKLDEVLANLEIRLIGEALERTKGNCAAAAELLGIKRSTLVERRRRYGFPLSFYIGRKKKT